MHANFQTFSHALLPILFLKLDDLSSRMDMNPMRRFDLANVQMHPKKKALSIWSDAFYFCDNASFKILSACHW